jgi:hypothetical protein
LAIRRTAVQAIRVDGDASGLLHHNVHVLRI